MMLVHNHPGSVRSAIGFLAALGSWPHRPPDAGGVGVGEAAFDSCSRSPVSTAAPRRCWAGGFCSSASRPRARLYLRGERRYVRARKRENIMTVVGAGRSSSRPGRLARHSERRAREWLVHTGQHYDDRMSRSSSTRWGSLVRTQSGYRLRLTWRDDRPHAGRTRGRNARATPDWVLVYGDTNSTLAADRGVQAGIPVAHVERGCVLQPQHAEEHNRVLTDHCADLLFCPPQTAVTNLANEGVERGVAQRRRRHARRRAALRSAGARALADTQRAWRDASEYFLATVHRAYNTTIRNAAPSDRARKTSRPGDSSVHPRTRTRLREAGAPLAHGRPHVRLVDPVGYLDMLMLEQHARAIDRLRRRTEEAYFFPSLRHVAAPRPSGGDRWRAVERACRFGHGCDTFGRSEASSRAVAAPCSCGRRRGANRAVALALSPRTTLRSVSAA